MNPIYLIFFVSYAAGFLLVAFLWRWYLALPISASLVLLLGWVLHGVFNEDSPGVIIAAPMVGMALLGVLAGFFASAIVLSMRRYSQAWATPIIVLPITFVTIPVIVFGLFTWQQASVKARRTPPSSACLTRLHPVVLGGTRLALPLAPAFSVGQGREYHPSYPLDVNEQARKFCEETAAGPVKITNLTARLTPDHTRHLAVRSSAFCAISRPYGWWHDLCRRTHDDDPRSDYPLKVTFYALGEYEANKMHAFSAYQLTRFKMDGLPMVDLAGGVRRYGEKKYPYFTRSDVPGYFARCYSTTQPNADLACVAGYRLTPRIGIIYDFTAIAADFPERSAIVDRRAREVFESLKPGRR